MKIALRVNPLIYKGFKVLVLYNFEINLSSVAVINKGLETPCEKNCPFSQRTPKSEQNQEPLQFYRQIAADKQKKVKGGRKSKLSVENRLLMALEYNKRIPYFHVSQSYGVNFKLTPRYNPSA